MELTSERVSYQQIKDGYKLEHDNYQLGAYLTDTRKNTFFANPNLGNLSQCLLSLERVDNVICGRCMLYETRVKIGENVYPAQSSSTLDVIESCRNLGLGACLFEYETIGTAFDYVICSGISDIALPLYKIMRYHLLEFPRMMYLRNTRSILESKGIKGMLLRVITPVANIPFHILHAINKLRVRTELRNFSIRRETVVPNWVGELALNDGHKYMEAHDREWLQWNLDYNFKGDKEDIQSLYTVYKDNEPMGFFMTKERYRLVAGGTLKNIVLSAIVEWGTYNENILNESTIISIALTTFTSKVDIIEFATSDDKVVSKMKSWGFIQHGFAHIAFKDKTKKCEDAKDIDNWRVRYGYADVILT